MSDLPNSHGRVFSGALSSILDFFEFEEFQYTRRSSLLDSTVYRWTRYSSFSSKIDFHRVTEFYSKYSTLKHARITSNIQFKVTRKSSTRLAIFKSFPDSVLDSTRFDFCRGGVPIGKLAHGCFWLSLFHPKTNSWSTFWKKWIKREAHCFWKMLRY